MRPTDLSFSETRESLKMIDPVCRVLPNYILENSNPMLPGIAGILHVVSSLGIPVKYYAV